MKTLSQKYNTPYIYRHKELKSIRDVNKTGNELHSLSAKGIEIDNGYGYFCNIHDVENQYNYVTVNNIDNIHIEKSSTKLDISQEEDIKGYSIISQKFRQSCNTINHNAFVEEVIEEQNRNDEPESVYAISLFIFAIIICILLL